MMRQRRSMSVAANEMLCLGYSAVKGGEREAVAIR